MSTGQDLIDFWKAVPVTTFPELGHSVRNSSLAFERHVGANKLSLQLDGGLPANPVND